MMDEMVPDPVERERMTLKLQQETIYFLRYWFARSWDLAGRRVPARTNEEVEGLEKGEGILEEQKLRNLQMKFEREGGPQGMIGIQRQ
jgi:hypothetical protein